MFCIAMATIERCKVEGVIDVFQLVKKMRNQLPGAVENKVHVHTCIMFISMYIYPSVLFSIPILLVLILVI